MRYIANPVEVDAFKITAVISACGDAPLMLRLDNGDLVTPTKAMMARMTPHVGDYWVIQSDGYVYLNPKDVFERKYHELEEAH